MPTTRKKDDWSGFEFPTYREKRPEDFLTDPSTGFRPGESKEPYGHALSDLTRGVGANTIPSKRTWRQGFWYAEWDETLGDKPKLDAWTEEFAVWVVPGEGTPGNYKWRLYELPEEISREIHPKHPADWPRNIRKPYSSGSSYSSDSGWGSSKNSGTKTSFSMPYGVRIRCPGCGHWFKADDLAIHTTNCCPATQGHSEWAMMCAPECGCENLDEVTTPKPGYPKQPVTSHKEGQDEPAKPAE